MKFCGKTEGTLEYASSGIVLDTCALLGIPKGTNFRNSETNFVSSYMASVGKSNDGLSSQFNR